MVKKLEATLQLQCIAALPYNHYFEDEVKKLQLKYDISEDLLEATKWFRNQHIRYNESGSSLLSNKYFTLDILGLEALHLAISLRSVEELINTRVPLEKDILGLLPRFRLGLRIFGAVLGYILTREKSWLEPSSWEPRTSYKLYNVGGVPELSILITLSPWTTKERWVEIWQKIVRGSRKSLRIFDKQAYLGEPAKKLGTVISLGKEMKRWSEWYQLSEIEGLGPTKTLEKWLKGHPSQYDKYDVSTVTHAIQDFKNIINPLPQS